MKTIVIRTFDNYILAHIVSDKLTNAGITNYIFDENTVTTIPIWGNAVGGIKIVVDKADEPAARQALFEIEEAFRKSAVCPRCGAREIISIPKNSPGNIFTAILSWSFSSYALAPNYVYHCKNCGYESDTLPEAPDDAEEETDLL